MYKFFQVQGYINFTVAEISRVVPPTTGEASAVGLQRPPNHSLKAVRTLCMNSWFPWHLDTPILRSDFINPVHSNISSLNVFLLSPKSLAFLLFCLHIIRDIHLTDQPSETYGLERAQVSKSTQIQQHRGQNIKWRINFSPVLEPRIHSLRQRIKRNL